MTLGVIIGRFQVPEIHAGHIQLLDHVTKQHEQMLVLLGCRPSPATTTNPLDFVVRERMLRQVFSNAIILPLYDKPTDEEWSAQVDAAIAGVFPYRKAVLYGGRDSFIPHYKGRYETRVLEFKGTVSGTDTRQAAIDQPRNSADFRSGIIYALGTLQPRLYLTVDIALLKGEQVLLGRKSNEHQWRFPGGFVDLQDQDIEAAARRELLEETGMTVEGRLTYSGSFTVNDWRTRGVTDAKHLTTLWRGEYGHGAPVAADDLAAVQWFSLGYDIPIHTSHAPLLAAVKAASGATPCTI